LDLVGPAWAVQKELASMPSMQQPEGDYGHEWEAVRNFKKIGLMVAGAAAKMQLDGQLNLREEQEILMNIADMLTEIFLTESVVLRVQKLKNNSADIHLTLYEAIMRVQVSDAQHRMQRHCY
jgi:hypothetical protein